MMKNISGFWMKNGGEIISGTILLVSMVVAYSLPYIKYFL